MRTGDKQRIAFMVKAFRENPQLLQNWNKPISDLDLSDAHHLSRARQKLANIMAGADPEDVAAMNDYLDHSSAAFVWRVLICILTGMEMSVDGVRVIVPYLSKFYPAFTTYAARHYYTKTFRYRRDLSDEEIENCVNHLLKLVYEAFSHIEHSSDPFRHKVINDGKCFAVIGRYPQSRVLRVHGMIATNIPVAGVGQEVVDELVRLWEQCNWETVIGRKKTTSVPYLTLVPNNK